MPASRFLDRRTPPTMITLILMTGMGAMANNIFLPSLPGMAEWFDAPYAQLQLSISLYLLLSGMMHLILGPLSDRFGRRPVALASCGVFLLATLGMVMAESIEMFLVCRMLQATVAACVLLGRAVVRDVIPGPEAATMISWVTMGMTLVPMVSPSIGGVLDQHFGWHAPFWLLLAVGIAVTTLIWADMGETSVRKQTSIGAQLRASGALLSSSRFWGYAIAATTGAGAFFTFMGGAPVIASQAWNLSAAQIGMGLAAPGIGYLVGNYLSGRHAARVGPVRMVAIGNTVAVLAPAIMLAAWAMDMSNPVLFFGAVILVGLGNGIALPSANVGMMSVRPDLVGSASGMAGALMTCGGGALAASAAALMGDGRSELPLVLLMLGPGIVSVLALVLVRRQD